MRQLDALRETITLAEERRMDTQESGLPEDCRLEHLKLMLMSVELECPRFSPSKLGRWLGWAQACVVAAGVATLEEMKQINMRHADDRT